MDAGDVRPGPAMYKVVYLHAHQTLKIDDLVRLVETPDHDNLLVRHDWTLHRLADKDGQYVHLQLVPT
jgi:hypothetical protein